MVRAADFDEGYQAAAGPTRRHQIFTEVLGLPPHVEPNSFVTMEVFERVARELRVGQGDRLVDLACGRGGPGLLVAKLTGADLVGVDFSRVAVAQARQRATLFVPAGRAQYLVGDLAATGLANGCADAVLCLDSIQFAPDHQAAVREAFRILRPGGRYVQTNWQFADPHDPAVVQRFRGLDFAALLAGAGFTGVAVEDRPDLAELVTAVFRKALESDAPASDDSLERLRDEAKVVLSWPTTIRRILVMAQRPAGETA
jgi:ubiquinone/menaquinone biosynthesis C-methylase UbiE